jgi:hypothetical protein
LHIYIWILCLYDLSVFHIDKRIEILVLCLSSLIETLLHKVMRLEPAIVFKA